MSQTGYQQQTLAPQSPRVWEVPVRGGDRARVCEHLLPNQAWAASFPCVLHPVMAQMVKNLPAMWEPRFSPWVGKIPWRREWHPTPVFLPGASHGQRSLEGYSLWSHRELHMTERQTHSTHVVQGAWKLPGVSVQRALILFKSAPPLCPKHLLKAPTPNSITANQG